MEDNESEFKTKASHEGLRMVLVCTPAQENSACCHQPVDVGNFVQTTTGVTEQS